LVGGWLLAEFHWILYVFGAFLIPRHQDVGCRVRAGAGRQPGARRCRILPVSKHYDGGVGPSRTERNATLLFMVICLVALTDADFRGGLDSGDFRHHQRPVPLC
jgi:tellurite resistance protein TerC